MSTTSTSSDFPTERQTRLREVGRVAHERCGSRSYPASSSAISDEQLVKLGWLVSEVPTKFHFTQSHPRTKSISFVTVEPKDKLKQAYTFGRNRHLASANGQVNVGLPPSELLTQFGERLMKAEGCFLQYRSNGGWKLHDSRRSSAAETAAGASQESQ